MLLVQNCASFCNLDCSAESFCCCCICLRVAGEMRSSEKLCISLLGFAGASCSTFVLTEKDLLDKKQLEEVFSLCSNENCCCGERSAIGNRSNPSDTHIQYVSFEREPISFTVSEVTDSFSLPPITFPKQSFQMASNWRQCTRIFLFASPFDCVAAPNPFNILELGQFIEECRFQLGLKAKFGD